MPSKSSICPISLIPLTRNTLTGTCSRAKHLRNAFCSSLRIELGGSACAICRGMSVPPTSNQQITAIRHARFIGLPPRVKTAPRQSNFITVFDTDVTVDRICLSLQLAGLGNESNATPTGVHLQTTYSGLTRQSVASSYLTL